MRIHVHITMWHDVSFFHTAYTTIGGDDELPLGEEFQEHLARFVRPNEKKVPKKIELVKKIVDQLMYVAQQSIYLKIQKWYYQSKHACVRNSMI